MENFGHDQLAHVAVGDPDPTLYAGTASGYRKCCFEWEDRISQNLILLWCCTRELGHLGQHLAGTGDVVAAAHANRCQLRRLPTSWREDAVSLAT
jgi:hypothetical protein